MDATWSRKDLTVVKKGDVLLTTHPELSGWDCVVVDSVEEERLWGWWYHSINGWHLRRRLWWALADAKPFTPHPNPDAIRASLVAALLLKAAGQ